jgi:long-chain acyl-CoA synthetase
MTTFNRLFEESIRKYWERPAFTDYGGETISYREAAGKILLLQAIFRRRSIKPGEKIALIGVNSANWALVYLAAVTYGAVIVPILPEFRDEDVQHILSHSESLILFADDEIAARIDEERLESLRTVVSLDTLKLLYYRDKHLPGAVREVEEEEGDKIEAVTASTFSLPPDRDEDEMTALVYTSGTSGFSKGAMLPYRSLLANVNFARENMRLEMAERTLCFLPLAHAYAASFDFLFPFTVGCHVTFLGQMPTPKVLIEAFAEVRPSLILFVPLIIEKLYKKRLAPMLRKGPISVLSRMPGFSVLIGKKIKGKLTETFGRNFKEIVVGGAALNEEVEAFMKKIKMPITVGYGMTECGPLISYSPWFEHRPQSVGRAITGLECRIDSPDPHHQVGEIMVRGPEVMLGYYKNREATREVLSEDGWLRTGDLGLIDEDGFIYIKGRSKNMILGPSGQNIYPEEIESRLNVLPYIQESLVLEEGGRLVALVYPDWDAVDAERGGKEDHLAWLTERMKENREEVNRHLTSYCRLAEIRLHGDAFEKTPTHKIKRYRYLT